MWLAIVSIPVVACQPEQGVALDNAAFRDRVAGFVRRVATGGQDTVCTLPLTTRPPLVVVSMYHEGQVVGLGTSADDELCVALTKAPSGPSRRLARTALEWRRRASSSISPRTITRCWGTRARACNPHPHATSAAQTAWAKRSLASSGSGSGSVRSQPRHPPPTARRYEDRGEGPAAHHGMIASAQRSSHARSSARLRISPRKASPKSRNRRRLAGPRRIAGQAGGASRYSPDSSSMCERSLLNSRR